MIGWLGFLISLVVMVLLGRKNLWLAFFTGATLLALCNLNAAEMVLSLVNTFANTGIMLLALAVGLIPLIGGSLENSGLMERMIGNLKISRKSFLIFAPALLGMLPMPGGALLSAPLVKRAGSDITPEQYVAINVWYRHALILIYPLGALLVTTKLAGVGLYTAMLYLLPGFALMVLLGWLFLLRGISGKLNHGGDARFARTLPAFAVLATAPLLHLLLMPFFPDLPEIALLIGVLTSLLLNGLIAPMDRSSWLSAIKRMKPWNYFLIVAAMFWYLHVFELSHVSELIAKLVFSQSFLVVVIAAFLGFFTGRTQMPFSILVPIYTSRFGMGISYPAFAIMFFSIYMGYIISPIHPCVCVSLEYFKSPMRLFMKNVVPLVLICLLFAFLAAQVLL